MHTLESMTDVKKIKFNQLESIFSKFNIRIQAGDADANCTLTIPDTVEIEPDVKFLRSSTQLGSIGSFSYTNSNLGYGIKVGRYCSIGPNLQVMGADHYLDWISTSPQFYQAGFHSASYDVSDDARKRRQIFIGNDVWIGSNVTLPKVVKIGDGAVIASNAVVTKDVPPFSVVGGVPAVVKKKRFSDELSSKISSLKWWNYNIKDLPRGCADEPFLFLENLETLITKRKINEWKPEVFKLSSILS